MHSNASSTLPASFHPARLASGGAGRSRFPQRYRHRRFRRGGSGRQCASRIVGDRLSPRDGHQRGRRLPDSRPCRGCLHRDFLESRLPQGGVQERGTGRRPASHPRRPPRSRFGHRIGRGDRRPGNPQPDLGRSRRSDRGGADQGNSRQRPQLGQPDAAGAGRGQLRRRLAAQHPLQRPFHRRRQLHLRRHRQQRRPGADPEGRNAAEHRARLHRRVSREHRRLHRGERRGRRRAGQRGLQDRHQSVSRQHVLLPAQRRAGCPLAVRRRDHPAVHPASVRRQFRRSHQERQGLLLRELRRPAAGSGSHLQISFVPNAAFRAKVLATSPVAQADHRRLPGRSDAASTAPPTRSTWWPATRCAKTPA